MAFAAENAAVPLLAWWLLAVNTLWSVIYDTLYAMVDREDDLAVGIKSTAILFGSFDILITGILMLLMIVMLTALGVWLGLNWPWFAAILIAVVLFGRQLVSVRHRDRDACFKAFLNNNWVGDRNFRGLARPLCHLRSVLVPVRFRRPCGHPDRDSPGACLFQGSCAFGQCRARRHYIIDQYHLLEHGLLSCRDPARECSLDIALATGRIEPGMGTCAPAAPQDRAVYRYSQGFSRLPGEQVGLVECP